MLTRKSKGVATILLLGAPSGASLSTLDLGSFYSPSTGGGANWSTE
ncbi:hypothetical protein [Candidatus Mycoplasma haematominutum]|uniref:Uncharacterized protein n=1 Tax=Candidatus Mycoplasma haematominutum 'Birmingham 1' TaxID=1116213 RepID=G8C3I7_9MOLU|nr:hypothetical protein [Candidatus Mycoplasma haematominutum]CCE66885.1 hypothetical protein MHM_03670 [Candidatus Mycoplasma haematominutum 'Birmingham 1']